MVRAVSLITILATGKIPETAGRKMMAKTLMEQLKLALIKRRISREMIVIVGQRGKYSLTARSGRQFMLKAIHPRGDLRLTAGQTMTTRDLDTLFRQVEGILTSHNNYNII
jgi:hypothetical protein